MDAPSFPLAGIVGIVGGDADEVAQQLEEAARCGLAGVEVRADLFENLPAAVECLRHLPPSLVALFTIRLEGHGGRYRGNETERLEFYEEALAAGAVLVDAEWGSDAATALAEDGAPVIVSHHDFHAMISPEELERYTRSMESLRPRAVKIVPTASRPLDGLRMLEWVAAGTANSPRRIGFAMGECALFSRVLSPAWQAPFTYASLGRSVAPGQVTAATLVEQFRAGALTRDTRLLGVVGKPVGHSLSPHMHNAALGRAGVDAVYLPFLLTEFDDLLPLVEAMPLDGVSVTIPFKEPAYRYAEADTRAAAAGAANTLRWSRDGGTLRASATNTDFDGVLEPLRRRQLEIRGLSVGVLGNGGAARGAVQALKEGGADVTMYYRNPQRGDPVAQSLEVRGQQLDTLHAGRHALLINATSLGLNASDPSPVDRAVFDTETLAFDMVYDPPETEFLRLAVAAGAETIPGREMLICQGLVQFRLFTGRDATYEEFETAFLQGQAARR